MKPETLFYIIIAILVISFIIDQILDYLNAKHFNDPLPLELQDVFEEKEYKKSQRYKKERYKFAILTSAISLIATLLFFFFDGFAYIDSFSVPFQTVK